MKELMFVLYMYIAPLLIFGCNDWDKTLQPDTIDDYSSGKRIFINLPEKSIKYSTEIYDCEGFIIMYPLFTSSGNVSPFTVDCSVMNRNGLIYTEDIDTELWNTFNGDNIGSRCFIKNGLYNRVDRYYDGVEIYYTDLPDILFKQANIIMKSFKTKVKKEDDIPLNRNKRKIVDNDSIRHTLY